MTRSSAWFADFWSRSQETYTPGYSVAHKALIEELMAEGINTPAEHQKAVRKMVTRWHVQGGAPIGNSKLDL